MRDCPAQPPHILQHLVFPHPHQPDRSDLFVRCSNRDVLLFPTGGFIRLPPGEKLDLSTYFNAISFAKWHDLTGLTQLGLRLCGTGRVIVSVVRVDARCSRNNVLKVECELNEEGFDIDLPNLSKMEGVICAANIEAIGDNVRISSGQWTTTEPPERHVELAIVITTFNRDRAIKEAFEKLAQALLDCSTTNHVHLFIIDNGRNVVLPEHSRVTVVPNRNLGGAGGFTRGLLEAIDAKKFTHCLFMDDDASCDPESISRAIALLARLKDGRAAVSGAMLLHEQPCLQAEKGAIVATDTKLPWYFVALNSRLNIAALRGVVESEGTDVANYGGWWFFAFPLQAVKTLPFPFFVRGDDVDFSLVNEFPIVTMNGIAAWCEAFAAKLVAPVEFLASRAWFALLLKHADPVAAQLNLRRVLRYAFGFGVRYDYAAFEAAIQGLEFAMRGPEAFAADPAPLQIMQNIRLSVRELPVPDARDQAKLPAAASDRGMRNRLANLLFKATLAGHFLPSARDPRPVYVPPEYDFAVGSHIRARRLIWWSGGRLVCVQRDRLRMTVATLRWLRLYFLSQHRLRKLGIVWREESSQFQNRDYWIGQLLAAENEMVE